MSEKYDIARHFWDRRDNLNYALTSKEVSDIFRIDLHDAQEILSKLRRRDKILDLASVKGKGQLYFLRDGVVESDIDALKSYTIEQLNGRKADA